MMNFGGFGLLKSELVIKVKFMYPHGPDKNLFWQFLAKVLEVIIY